jgi:hypothetical protein
MVAVLRLPSSVEFEMLYDCVNQVRGKRWRIITIQHCTVNMSYKLTVLQVSDIKAPNVCR